MAGGSSVTVAESFGCARSTVVRLVHRFADEGIAGLIDRREENGERKQTPDVSRLLRSLIGKPPTHYGFTRSTWTREMMKMLVAEQLGLVISVTTIGRALRALKIVWRRARPVLLGACPRRVYRTFQRKLTRLISRAGPENEILFVDEMDIHLNPRIGSDWMRRGKQKTVRTPGQNRKRFLAGAYNQSTGNLVWVIENNKRSDLFMSLVRKISSCYRRASRIHLILDNYSIHTSRRTQSFLKQYGDRIRLHFLPPYGQDLNEIERLWKQVHENVTRNHRHATIDELVIAVEHFMRSAIPFPGSKPSVVCIDV
jgi:transposase